jgi:thiamine-phosphate pyrophosphorylase
MWLTTATPGVLRALEAAQRCAGGAAAVEPLHLLLGLLDEPDGQAAALLARHGCRPQEWRVAFARDSDPERDSPLPLSGAVQRAGLRAAELARSAPDGPDLTTAHLLLALLEAEGTLRDSLAGYGLIPEGLAREWKDTTAEALQTDLALDLTDPVEQSDAARILDASANRAREALRVLEDFCRFALDDAGLSRQLKELRHDLADALADLPAHLLLAARDTLHDVGTDITTDREQRRYSLDDVVRANVKRLQEALRSLEE